MPNVPPYNVCT